MINRIRRYLNYFNYFHYFRGMAKLQMGLARGAATSGLRNIDYTAPLSWEFCGLSQNGEDGILDVLTQKLLNPNRYSIEIGTTDGTENNTLWLALARRYTVLMVEGTKVGAWRCQYLLSPLCYITSLCLFANKNNMDVIKKNALYMNPDVFSLDIDGIDYYVAEAFLNAGFRPKIIVVEYNSSMGPSKSIAIEYRENIYEERVLKGKLPMFYWGCSITGWKNFLGRHGYKFLTIESNGVNAFFIDPKEFDDSFVSQLKEGIHFRQNASTFWYFKNSWEEQFNLIEHLPFIEVK